MKIETLGTEIFLEAKDYFVFQEDADNTVSLVLTAGNRKPIKLRKISRKQLYNLLTQINRLLTCEAEQQVDNIVGEVEINNIVEDGVGAILE